MINLEVAPYEFVTKSNVTTLAFHPDETYAFLGNGGGEILVINLQKGTVISKISPGPYAIKCLHVTPNTLLTFDEHHQISHWDLKTFELKHTIALEKGIDWGAGAFVPEGSYLVVERLEDYQYSSLHKIDTTTGQSVGKYDFEETRDADCLTALAVSQVGSKLAASSVSFTTSCDGDRIGLRESIWMWDAHSREFLGHYENAHSSLQSIHTVIPISFSHDGEKLAFLLDDEVGVMKCRGFPHDIFSEDFPTWGYCEPQVQALACSPNNETFAVGAGQGNLHFLDPIGITEISFSKRKDNIFNTAISELKFSPNGSYLGALDSGRHVKIFPVSLK